MIFATNFGQDLVPRESRVTQTTPLLRTQVLTTQDSSGQLPLAPENGGGAVAPSSVVQPTTTTTATTQPKSKTKTWLIVGGGIVAALGLTIFLARR